VTLFAIGRCARYKRLDAYTIGRTAHTVLLDIGWSVGTLAACRNMLRQA